MPGFFDTAGVAKDQAAQSLWLLEQESGAKPEGISVQPSKERLLTLKNAPADQGRLLVGLNLTVGAKVAFQADGKVVGSLGALRKSRNNISWFTTVRSPDASAMRLHLTNMRLPVGVELYLYSRRGEAFGPTPAPISKARASCGRTPFAVGSSAFICSGGLVNDANTSTTVPYFLTANHCISRQSSANSIEAFFQFNTSCGGSCPSASSSLPRMLGSTLLVSSANSDFCLLQLNGSVPGGPSLLGWTTTAVANSNSTDLFRISHPKGAPQAYSRQDVSTTAGTCGSIPRGNFIYSRNSFGATEGGSSGSPVLNSGGQIVGQLFGACGTNTRNVCDSSSNATVDDAFAVTFSSISQFINNPGNTSCHSGANGSASFCRSGCKCEDGEGDCDSNSECVPGTTCLSNVGPNYGFASWVDVCETSGGGGGGPNSCVGNCGGQASGGCWCDSACAGFGDCCGDKLSVCG